MLRRYGPFWLCSGVIAALSFGSAVLPSGLRAARQESSRPPTGVQQALAPEALEWALFESINKERAARNLPALRLSPPLSEVARKHSEEMARLRRFAHESAEGGSLKERLDRARIANALNAENVARSDSFDPGLIHEALMKSEGHRDNILLPNVNEVGIGVVRGPEGKCYVTQDFLRSVTWLGETEARKAVLAVLDDVRRSRGLVPLVVFDEISQKALAFARRKAEGRRLPVVPREYGETRIDFYAGVELDGIAAKIREQSLDRYRMGGIGVHVAPAPGYPSGAYQVCTLLLTADPALLQDEPAQVRTVLKAVNDSRAERGLGPLDLDAALSDKADDSSTRYRKNKTASGVSGATGRFARLAHAPAMMTTVVLYETWDLGRLAPGVQGQVAGGDTRKVGISVKPSGAGLTVHYVVVLVF